jgi:pimeloyl-ACP methyl ester carboxylesterase
VATGRRLIRLTDGRNIDVLTAGPEDGLPLVIHEGTPIGLEVFPPTVEAVAQRGLRVVMVARPGYEQSTPRPGRRVRDIATDVAQVLDALGADTFVTAGWSGGGPHALACAACLPGRCLAAASVSGVGPYGVEGLDFFAGMGPENVEEFSTTLRGEEELTRAITGEDVAAALGGLASDADKAVLTGEYAAAIAAGLRGAVRNGIAGWRDDDFAFAADWGFALDALDTPVAIWQGDQDRMVPYAHGQWLAAHIPGARAHLMPGEGHLTLAVSAIGQILDDLLDMAGLSTH